MISQAEGILQVPIKHLSTCENNAMDEIYSNPIWTTADFHIRWTQNKY